MEKMPIDQMDVRRLGVELTGALTANRLLLEANLKMSTEIEKLKSEVRKLNALEAASVDNWEGYDYAMEILEEQNETEA